MVKIFYKTIFTPKYLIFIIWIIYLSAFLFEFNFFPFVKFDLYSRMAEFSLSQYVFLAKPVGKNDFTENISSQFFFSAPWKFIITIRIIRREHPEKLESILKNRLIEINQQSTQKYTAVQFITILEGKQTNVSEVNIE